MSRFIRLFNHLAPKSLHGAGIRLSPWHVPAFGGERPSSPRSRGPSPTSVAGAARRTRLEEGFAGGQGEV